MNRPQICRFALLLALLVCLAGCSNGQVVLGDITFRIPKGVETKANSSSGAIIVTLLNDPEVEEGCLHNERGALLIQANRIKTGLTDEDLRATLSSAMEKDITRFEKSYEDTPITVTQRSTEDFLGVPAYRFSLTVPDEAGQIFRYTTYMTFYYQEIAYSIWYYTFPQCQDEASLQEIEGIFTGIVDSIQLQ